MFEVTGSGGYCKGGPGLQIGLSGSQTGVLYTMYYGCCDPVGVSVEGTGAPITFPDYQTAPGLYSIHAENMTTHCSQMMTGCTTIWIIEPLPVSVLIHASAVNPIPAGNAVTFTATPVNGGTLPVFTWVVNGLYVVANSPVFTYVPNNGDEVACVLKSSESCVSGSPAASNTLTIEVEGVSQTITVAGIIYSGKTKCYDATQTLLVAGNGTTFTVQNGGAVTMIAGQNIRYLPGTSVRSGGSMHGYITSTNQYCGQKSPAIPAVITGEGEVSATYNSPLFTIYPNPTSGIFMVEQTSAGMYGKVIVEIYNICGERAMVQEITGEMKHEFRTPGLLNGLYFVKIRVNDSYIKTFKLVKLR